MTVVKFSQGHRQQKREGAIEIGIVQKRFRSFVNDVNAAGLPCKKTFNLFLLHKKTKTA